MSRLKKMTTFKDERGSYIVATATFPGCGECSGVYRIKPIAAVPVKGHLKQQALLQANACEAEEG